MTDWRDIPIYITNFNNLERGFRRLLAWLTAAGHTNVTVIDNASTWAPLLEFYAQSPELMVMHMASNLGPYAFWQLNLQAHHEGMFVVTDPDVVPALTCPHDLVGRMLEAMEQLPASPCKVGPSLRIDNLPAHYAHKEKVFLWEPQFWQQPVGDAYVALIDTTFALYRPKSEAWPPVGTHYRLAPPYVVEHVPWYEDSGQPNPEREHYQAMAKKEHIHW